MKRDSIIFDFSGVYLEEKYPLRDSSYMLDCRNMEGTSCYCDSGTVSSLEKIASTIPSRTVNWIDGGDYHYMSKILSGRVTEDFTLLLLDHHPDMQPPSFGGVLSCGGWLRDALDDNPHLISAVIVGVDDSLLEECEGFGDKVSVIPESRLSSLSVQDVISGLPEERGVYLSIDKDVLSRRYAPTNWDNGSMELPFLLSLVKELDKCRDILGVDVCGELQESKGAVPEDFLRNSRTNSLLWRILSEGEDIPCDEIDFQQYE